MNNDIKEIDYILTEENIKRVIKKAFELNEQNNNEDKLSKFTKEFVEFLLEGENNEI